VLQADPVSIKINLSACLGSSNKHLAVNLRVLSRQWCSLFLYVGNAADWPNTSSEQEFYYISCVSHKSDGRKNCSLLLKKKVSSQN